MCVMIGFNNEGDDLPVLSDALTRARGLCGSLFGLPVDDSEEDRGSEGIVALRCTGWLSLLDAKRGMREGPSWSRSRILSGSTVSRLDTFIEVFAA